MNNLAWLLRAQGDYEGARLHNERALSIHESAFGPDHPDTASSLNHLALLLVDLGMLGEAATLSDRAIQGSEAQRRRVAWALAESERLLLSRKQRVALDLFLSIARLQSSDAARDAYDNILRWKAHVLRSLVQSRGRVLAGLSEADQGRVASLRQLQGRLSRELFRKNIEDREAHQELLANLRARRQAIERELNRSLGSVEDEDPVSASKLGQALPAGAVLVDFLVHRVYVPARREGERVVEEGRWAEPRLSAWIVHPGATGALRWIDLGDAAPIETAVRRFLDEMIASRGVSRVAEHSPESQQAPVSANDELRHLLWEPLSEFVGDSKRVFVSPDGFLGTLPFETIQLADGTYLIERMSFVYLENGDAIVDIAQAVETEAVPDLLCVGDVNYRRKSDLAWRSAAGSQDDLVEHEAPFENASELSMATRAAPTNLFARADVRGGFLKPWATLRATAEETEAILEAHDDRYKGTDARRLRLTGRDATEERVKRELARHDIVHIATHGFFQPEGLPSMWRRVAADEGGVRMEMLEEERRIVGLMPGLLSGLVLAGANKIPEEGRDDGLLTAEEISMLDLSDVDLVVLSACETALGKAEAGEGMLGLRRMFRQAGARTVVSSLWKVGDHATSELMQIFYDRMWSRDESPAAALRGAQLDKLKQNRIENNGDGLPSTWGAFVLDGAW
ncbi:MAG: hypothetical protein DHS20C21_22040 [Gemmatimonadota bacterium]|nr:MAG: hypothetical protein DHS20C21_22040 [Gemmatimonadota bacterium]